MRAKRKAEAAIAQCPRRVTGRGQRRRSQPGTTPLCAQSSGRPTAVDQMRATRCEPEVGMRDALGTIEFVPFEAELKTA